jgi:DnaK suppressor protein
VRALSPGENRSMPRAQKLAATKQTRSPRAVKATTRKGTSKGAAKPAAKPAAKAAPKSAKTTGKAAKAASAKATKTSSRPTPRATAAKAGRAETKKPPAARSEAPAEKAPKATKATPPKGRKVVVDKWLQRQREKLLEERSTYIHQAQSLRLEAEQLAEEMEPGDIQFDEESGEGATMNVERERDLALSAQAEAAVEEIDKALAKIEAGTYGRCEQCGQPIVRARLEALPYAALCVACKSGGLSRS